MLTREEIFNLKVNCFDYFTIENQILKSLQFQKQISLGYINFYSVNIAKKNPNFLSVINSMDLVFLDGTGIFLAAKVLKKTPIKKRFNLTDFGFDLLNFFAKNNLSIFLFGGKNSTLIEAKERIQFQYSDISITGMLDGYSNKSDDEIINVINNTNSDILLIGFGTPKQEEWICNNKNKLNVPIIFAVGDLFSLFAGKKKRGPAFIQYLGLEWFVRLITNPRYYYKRYLLGIPLFFFYLIKELPKIKK